MAYIAPSTIIKFCKDVGVEPSYQHTIYFTSLTNQKNWFNSRVKANTGGHSFTLTSQSYQRFGRNKLRVAIPVELLYDCSYIMFQNASFGDKWFFAFITGLEYVNNETSEITYKIDAIQTWMFDANGNQGWRLSRCFIERQHSSTDVAGDNLVPENLDFGDYIYREQNASDPFSIWYIVVATTFNNDTSLTTATGTILNNVYNGLHFFYFTANQTGVDSLNTFLGRVTDAQKSDGIVSIFMYPYYLIPSIPFTSSPTFDIVLSRPTTLGTYTPRNKKLLTSPYNCLYVTDFNGQSAIFKYEYFPVDVKLEVRGSISCAPEILVYPKGYNGVSNNVNERLLMTNLPQCAYAIDAYRAWIAMSTNKVNLASGVIMGGIDTVNGLATVATAPFTDATIGQGARQTVGGVMQVASTLASWHDAQMMPAQAKSTGNGTGLMGADHLKVGVYQVHVRDEFARIIDGYFDMFGYATHQVGIPNITSRQNWNYIKTQNCLIGGNLPSFAEEEICKIFDNGITFWHNPANVGNYTLSNNIVT